MPRALAALAAVLLLPASASADITGSSIQSPTGPVAAFTDGDPAAVLTASVTGDSPGDTVDVYAGCGPNAYHADGPGDAGYPVEPAGVVHVPLEDIDYIYCPLQVVPHGESAPHDATAFVPRVLGMFGFFPESGGFFQSISGPAGYSSALGAGDCAIGDSFTVRPDYGWIQLLGCSGLLGSDPADSAHPLLQVGGVDAFLPGMHPGTPAPQITDLTHQTDPATGVTEVSDREAVSFCSGVTCTPAPVRLEHRFRADHGGVLATITDVWRNDGAQPAELTLGYAFTLTNARSQIELGGVFGDVTTQVLPTPSGPGSYRVLADRDQAGDGDVDGARGTLFFSSRPTKVETVAGAGRHLVVRYARTIPPGGSLRLTYGAATAITQAAADTAVAGALSALKPTVAITAPAAGATIASPTATVSGTAADDGGTPAVKVNGIDAAVNAAGVWSAQVTLAAGVNTITATATDVDGNTATATRSVTQRTPPAVLVPPPSISNVRVKQRRNRVLVVRADLPSAGAFRARLIARVRRPGGGKRKLVLAKATTAVAGSGPATLRLKPTKKAKRLLRQRPVRAKLKLAFTNTAGTAKATRTVRVKRLRR